MTNFNPEELSETSIPGIKLKPGGSIKVSGDAKMKLIIDGKEIDLKNFASRLRLKMTDKEKPVINPEELQKPNTLGESLKEWWDSDACKGLQKSNEEAKQRAVGKYFMLSEEDKLDIVQAICYILCKAEKEGTSHRGLMDALGIYPAGFWVSELLTVHNSLWSYYHDKKQEEELDKDIKNLQDFMET